MTLHNINATKASDLFVQALEAEGVDYIFAVPGEENLDMVESLRTSSIQLVLTRHEQGAAFMAATYGRLTGKAGVCMATLGPGATNFATPAAYAHLGALPPWDPLGPEVSGGRFFHPSPWMTEYPSHSPSRKPRADALPRSADIPGKENAGHHA